METFGPGEGIVAIEENHLASMKATAADRRAIETLQEDLRLLREAGRDPTLNCVHSYPRDERPGPVQTDVFSWHADRAPVETDTWLCTYFGPPSEGLPNEEAERYVDIPAIRAELRKSLGFEDDNAEFREVLEEHSFDLHYAAAPGARAYSFGVGHLWRIAVQWPASAAPPCIHRAPTPLPASPPRLLLIC